MKSSGVRFIRIPAAYSFGDDRAFFFAERVDRPFGKGSNMNVRTVIDWNVRQFTNNRFRFSFRNFETITTEEPAILMGYSEVLFLQAEAAPGGWITDEPKTLYEQAIMASFEYWDVSLGVEAMNSYLQQDGVANRDIPRRKGYPYSEFTLNGDNYNAAIATQGPDVMETRLWWDVEN